MINVGAGTHVRGCVYEGRSWAFSVLVLAISLILAPVASAAPGDLDTSFGGGVVQTDFGNGANFGQAIVTQSDGKTVVGGLDGDNNFALVRYSTNGSLDTSFSGDGVATTNFLSSGTTSFVNGVLDLAVQSDGKILASGYSSLGGVPGFGIARFNTDGALDTSFSGDGKVTTPLGGGFGLTGIAVQADGKIVGVGSAGGEDKMTFVRYNSDGSLDTTFDIDGKAVVGFGGFFTGSVARLVLQADGKIVAVGAPQQSELGVVRLNTDGSLDTSFSGDGRETIDFADFQAEYAHEIAVQSDGKIVVSGTNGTTGFSVARLTTAGALDSTFDSDGKVLTTFPSHYGSARMSVQTDGKIVVVGRGTGTFGTAFGIVRYNTDGSLDSSFDGDGKLNVDLSDTAPEAALAVSARSDGKLTISGLVGSDLGVLRLNSDGTNDTSFSSDGEAITDLAGGRDSIQDLVIQPDGKFVVAGTSAFTDEQAPFDGINVYAAATLARYNPNGTLDTSFSGDGKLSPADLPGSTLNTWFGSANGLALQPDGKILMVSKGHTDDLRLTRVNSNGTYDTSFSGDGVLEVDIGAISIQARDLLVQSDGKILLLAGSSSDGLTLVRFSASGTLDTSFGGDGVVSTGITDLAPSAEKAGLYSGFAMQPDGKVVVVGGGLDFAVARYNTDGSPDITFDGDGKKVFSFGSEPGSYASGVAIQANGRIVVSGNSSEVDFALVRLNGDGSFDTSFSGDGKQGINFGAGPSAGSAGDVQLLPDGRIIVAGTSLGIFESDGDFAVARYNPNGSLDSSFSGDGRQTVPLGASAFGSVAALQGDGAIVVAGQSDQDFALARFEGGGAPPIEDPEPPEESCATNPALCATGGGSTDGSNQVGTDLGGGAKPAPSLGKAVIANVAVVVGGKAQLQARCGTRTACKGLAKLKVKVKDRKAAASKAKTVIIGSSRFNIPAGKSRVIKIKLTATGKQLIKKAGPKGLPVNLFGTGLKMRTIKLKPKARQLRKRKRMHRVSAIQVNESGVSSPTGDRLAYNSDLSQTCAKAGMAKPKVREAWVRHPGDRKTQSMFVEADWQALPEDCNGRFVRLASVRFQLQSPRNHARWINVGGFVAPQRKSWKVKEELEAEKEAEGKSCWEITEAGKTFACHIPLGVTNKGGDGTAYAPKSPGPWPDPIAANDRYRYRCTPGPGVTQARALIRNVVRSLDAGKVAAQRVYKAPVKVKSYPAPPHPGHPKRAALQGPC